MRNSLMVRLMGAFLLVIAIGAGMTAVNASLATQTAFNLYTTRSGQVWAQSLAPQLADYYASQGNWKGVDAVLQSASFPMGMAHGMGMGRGNTGGSGMAAMMDQRMILADGQGIVVADTGGQIVGQRLTESQLEVGAPVVTDGVRVGTIFITPGSVVAADSPAGQFLNSVRRSILWSSVTAGLVALALGGLLFIQITAPLRKLSSAAEAIASGDLSQRVAIRSKDELGRLGRSFNRMAENLSRAELQRKHMIADVAHELRTPLTVLQAGLEGMQDGVIPMDQEQIESLHEQTLLLNRLVGDLRLLSLMDAGELQLERQRVDPSGFLRKVVDSLQPQAAAKGIALNLDAPAALPEIAMDTDRMTQVIANLISNALRYTPEGGTITVSARQAPEGVEISVTDTGPGIAPEHLPLIFDRFYRADPSRARASGGSGLGLAIVKQLVEAHGGMVQAESPVFSAETKAYGSKFRLILPAAARSSGDR